MSLVANEFSLAQSQTMHQHSFEWAHKETGTRPMVETLCLVTVATSFGSRPGHIMIIERCALSPRQSSAPVGFILAISACMPILAIIFPEPGRAFRRVFVAARLSPRLPLLIFAPSPSVVLLLRQSRWVCRICCIP